MLLLVPLNRVSAEFSEAQVAGLLKSNRTRNSPSCETALVDSHDNSSKRNSAFLDETGSHKLPGSKGKCSVTKEGGSMDFLKNRVAIITGGTGAIGRVMSFTFSKLGAKLVICGTNQQKTSDLVSELKSEGGEAISAVADVADFDQVTRMVEKVIEAFGKIDILVNNAVAKSIERSPEKNYPRNRKIRVGPNDLCQPYRDF